MNRSRPFTKPKTEVKRPSKQLSTASTIDNDAWQADRDPSPSQNHDSETFHISPAVPLEELQSRAVVGAVMHEEHNSTSSRERLTQSTPTYRTRASDDTEHREWLLSQHGSVLSRSSRTGRLEAGVSTNDQRRWEAHHQDLYASKWFKALIWLIFAAIFSAACVIFTFFATGNDIFSYGGIYFWLICVAPLVGTVFLWVPGGVLFSKVFR